MTYVHSARMLGCGCAKRPRRRCRAAMGAHWHAHATPNIQATLPEPRRWTLRCAEPSARHMRDGQATAGAQRLSELPRCWSTVYLCLGRLPKSELRVDTPLRRPAKRTDRSTSFPSWKTRYAPRITRLGHTLASPHRLQFRMRPRNKHMNRKPANASGDEWLIPTTLFL